MDAGNVTSSEYSPAKGVAYLRRFGFYPGAVLIRAALRQLRAAQSADDSLAIEGAYAVLSEVAPTHAKGALLYSRVDATIVSRIVPSEEAMAAKKGRRR